MDLINWSLSAIDTLFSTRSLGSGEPECPGGMFPAGYMMDGWQNWRVEEIYLFGTMITGFLLIGAGLALAYRRLKKAESAVINPTRLPAVTEAMGWVVTSQKGLIEHSTDKNLEKLEAAVSAQTKTSERKLDNILEKLPAVLCSQNLLFERKIDNISEKLTAVHREIERLVSDC